MFHQISEVRADKVANQKLPALKLGLEVHADPIVVVRMLDNSTPQPAQKFTPAKFLTWVRTPLPLAGQVHSCYEASPFGFGLHRDLVALGVRNVVVQPVCLDERHKGVNHDKSDAHPLALATVRVPTPEEEQKGVESRQRFINRRQVGSDPGYAAGSAPAAKVVTCRRSPNTATRGCAPRWWNWPGG